MVLQRLIWLVASVSATQVAPIAAPVQRLRAKVDKVVPSASIPASLANANASKALTLKQKDSATTTALTNKSVQADDGQGDDADDPEAEKAADAYEFSEALVDKLTRVLSHIDPETIHLSAAQETQRVQVVAGINAAMSIPPDQYEARAAALGKAMQAAHAFMVVRTEALEADQLKEKAELVQQEGHVLYMMLKQRKRLPMRSQLAILKRQQFVGCDYAQSLLKQHTASKPLYEQLEALLPKDQVAAMNPKQTDAGHLAAAGSDGRVRIVSSQMKNTVKGMVKELTAVRNKLLSLAKPGNKEGAQAIKIAASLDDALNKVKRTNDLKVQLDVLDAVQKQVGVWTAAAR